MCAASSLPQRWVHPERIAAIASAVAAVVGSLVMMGWWLDLTELQSVFPELPRMVPNTAVSLILAAVALMLLRQEPVPAWRRYLAWASATTVASIGLVTLVEYVIDVDWYIDRLLIDASADSQRPALLGRPGFPTAWTLVLIGCGLWLMDVRPRRCPELAQFLMLLAVTIALLALTGFACGVANFYGRVTFWPHTGMALHTALVVTLLGVGIMVARPQRGLMAILLSAESGGVVARRIILAPVAIPLILGVLQVLARRTGVYTSRMDWPQLGGWLFSLLNIFLVTLIVWWSTSLIHRADAERSRLNLSLETVNRELEDRVAQRTTELEAKSEDFRALSQQLWQAAKLATIGELAASIAHELNNPLATINLHLESLHEETAASSPAVRRLKVVEQEIDRMAQLVANLLQFSRPGQQQISTLDIQEELQKTLEIIYYVFRKNRIHVAWVVAPEVPMVQADRQKLRQVFLNVLMNACDAMPTGGTLTLRMAAAQLPPATPAVVIEVADTGVGIAAHDLPHVMEPFFTTKQEGKGTGLGLAICRRIVQEHHGTMEFASEVNRGTTVRIVLPVANASNGKAVGA
jgi:signal transduction histidine kinase